MNKDDVRNVLDQAMSPVGQGSLGDVVEWIAACDGIVSLKLHVPGASQGDLDQVARAASTACRMLEGLQRLTIEFVDKAGTVIHRWPQPEGHRPIGGLDDHASGIPGVKHIIAVGAGKGGVGKSTVAVNLAVGLARRGHSVGILDGDIYGPSLPTLLGLEAEDTNVHEGMLQPFVTHGVRAMTIGKLVEADKPLIWRGPMAHGAFKQIAEQTSWGELEYLVIDLPPGTGDVPLTMAQLLSLTGAIIVCTPQKVAQDDALRAVRMFQQLNVEILGLVENMSAFIGDDGKEYDIFGRGGVETLAQRLGVPFLGALPLTMALRFNSDIGNPSANFEESDTIPDKALRAALDRLLTTVEGQVSLASLRHGEKPTLKIS